MTDYESERDKERKITMARAREARRVAEEKQAAVVAKWEREVQRQKKLAKGSCSDAADRLLDKCQKTLDRVG